MVGGLCVLMYGRIRLWRLLLSVSFTAVQTFSVALAVHLVFGPEPVLTPDEWQIISRSLVAVPVFVVPNLVLWTTVDRAVRGRSFRAGAVIIARHDGRWWVSYAATPLFVLILVVAPWLMVLAGILMAAIWQTLVVIGRRTEQARTDALTGLANRFGLFEDLDALLSRRGAVLLFADLDDFKTINDSFGHTGGDAVLAEVGRRIAGWVKSNRHLSPRSDSVAARIGGDEFVVLLAEESTDEQVAAAAAELTTVLAQPIWVGQQAVRVSWSVGWNRSEAGIDALKLLHAADSRLYRHKRARPGRRDTPPPAAAPGR
ncbi:diguanylate cyclase domain-containing protein [Nakamurella aerolata]|uniref:GGDEF domain-containing protein n=1 Tax=Nakamurella aerolata TaxID=1656892 RepID=A0A849A703_9ACTN|nr:GGDEF domain-containing protein [Nakamurella aerolata]